jgi:hypothetical protein
MTQEFGLFKKKIDNTPINCHAIGGFFGVLMVKLQRQYKTS